MSAGRVAGCVAGASARAAETNANPSNAMQQAAFIVISEPNLPTSVPPYLIGEIHRGNLTAFASVRPITESMPPTCAQSVSTDTLAHTQAMSNVAANRAAIARNQGNLCVGEPP